MTFAKRQRHLLSAALVALPVLCAAEPASIRIGAVNPYTGPAALYGDELARGYQLAIDEVNAKGGVLGRKVELVRGDATNPQQGIAAAERLATQEKVDLMTGTYISAVSNAASDAAARYNKIYWDTNAMGDALGAAYMEGVIVVGYPRPDQQESFGPGGAAFLAAYRKKYDRDPIAPQSLTSYVGMKILLEAVAAAGSTEMEKVRAAAAKMDKPLRSYATGFGVKFDANMQNTRAFPTVVQWQNGKVITVYPAEAAPKGVKLVNVPRK